MCVLTTGIFLIALIFGGSAFPRQYENVAVKQYSPFFDHTDPNTRIVGGNQAADGSVPYMVSLSSGVLIKSYVCGGALVTTRSIVTAAHCIEAVYSRGSLTSSLRASVGSNQWRRGGISYTLARNITHQHYVSSLIKNDIGLLITERSVTLSNTIMTVPMSMMVTGGGVTVFTAGWGATSQGGSISSTLQQLFVETVDAQTCVRDVAEAASAANLVAPPIDPNLEICTIHSPGVGMCTGDSGSPLVRLDSGQLIGVLSWGIPCARNASDVFVRISSYGTWLFQNLI